MIEKDISSRSHNSALINTSNRTIVKAIPFISVFSIGSVVTATQTALMVAHSVQLIDWRDVLWDVEVI